MANAAISCGDCDSTPEISNIHMVLETEEYTDWEYTITCTSECGPETAVGTFRLVPLCGISEPLGFSIEICNVMPTNEEIIDNADLECTCPDTTPVITVQPHEIDEGDPDPNVITWEYTAFCGSDAYPECGESVVGRFDNRNCQEPCGCTPTAPDLCSCIGFGFPTELFDLYNGGCHPAPDCDLTPTYEIDGLTGVDQNGIFNEYGMHDYTVTCNGCANSPVTVTGRIFIDHPTCGPDAETGEENCVCNCCPPGPPT